MQTTITNKTIADDANDNLRLAFNRLNRVIMPVLCKSDRFEADYFYYTDIMHDAATMAAMKSGESRWMMLTSSGTFMFNTGEDMRDLCAAPAYRNMGIAIYRITCTRAEHEYLPAVWDIETVTV
jgi:hypothetical protein